MKRSRICKVFALSLFAVLATTGCNLPGFNPSDTNTPETNTETQTNYYPLYTLAIDEGIYFEGTLPSFVNDCQVSIKDTKSNNSAVLDEQPVSIKSRNGAGEFNLINNQMPGIEITENKVIRSKTPYKFSDNKIVENLIKEGLFYFYFGNISKI